MTTGATVRVASYNIHRCVGRDGRCEPERIAAVLAEIDADVVALQEVDADHWHEGGLDQMVVLSTSLGLEAVAGPTLRGGRGHYGNALLSRLPIESVRHHDLSFEAREPRGAIDAGLHVQGQALRVVATHLGLRRVERRWQLRFLASLVDESPEEPFVLAGDMNEWIPRALAPLTARLGASRRLRTFPAHRPLLALDRLWARPRGALRDVRVHRSAIASIASDHLPLTGLIDL